MLSPIIGEGHRATLAELRDNWLAGDAPVALLDGFSGCGKSILAGELAASEVIRTARVDAVAEDSDLQNLFLDLALALESVGINSLSNETQKGANANFPGALRETLRRNRVLVIIDQAEQTFGNEPRPPAKLAGVIQQLGKGSSLGKLLFVSNRIFEHAVWSENCFRVRLAPLQEAEAVDLLTQLLEHHNRADKVEPDTRADLVRCFGCNPRAIHTLVTCLEFETLGHLISTVPGMWDLRDIEVSPELVAQLEEDLLGRILPRLEDEKDTAKFLRWLAVHRKPFRKEALEEFQGAGFQSAELVRSLVERMLLEYRHGWHTLNAIAREVSVQRLRDNSSDWVQANSLAANYHARHFRAQQIVHVERLTGSFAELRYHLYHAGRLSELKQLSERFTTFIRRSINIFQIPNDPAKLEERIALLSVLLADQGAKGLEFHLARCLLKRSGPGDREAALDHIRRATGPQAPCETWLIRIDLEWEHAGLVDARSVWREAMRWVPGSGNAFSIYQRASELLAQDCDLKGAIALLREGIEKIPPQFSQFSLYQQCGELLARDGDLKGAIALLREGIEKIPPQFSQFSLYQQCGELLAQDGDLKGAIALLREGIGKIPTAFHRSRVLEAALRLAAYANRKEMLEGLVALADGAQRYLAHGLIAMVDEDWAKVLAAAEDGLRVRIHGPLILMKAEAHIGLRNLEAAWIDLQTYEGEKAEKGNSVHWLKAWISLRTNRQEDADRLAVLYAGAGHEIATSVTEPRLVRLWSTANHGLNEPLTTWFRSLRHWLEPADGEERIEPRAEPAEVARELDSRCFLVVTTEWDSKNGGLSTFNRMLCKALAKAKHTVVCFVPSASEDEIARAAGEGVILATARSQAGVAPMATLLVPPEDIGNLKPDFVVGHDRQSGGYAKVLQERVFSESKRIHLIHTAPEEIEPSKLFRSGTAARRGEDRVKEQKEEAKDSVLIVAVGPRLAREFGNHVHGAGFAPVYELIPGFDSESNDDETVALPPAIVCLVVGRAEDYELKGLDLAAQAMGALTKAWKPFVLPKLVVRGAPQGTGDDLSRRLREDVKLQATRPLQVTVREYSEDLEAIQNDLRGASLLLMPSCVEGFGLIAAEAISAGVPILISEHSGIAEILPEDSRNCILATRPDALTPLDPGVTKTWAEAIARMLNGREAAFTAAKHLKRNMATRYTWEEATRGLLTALGVSATVDADEQSRPPFNRSSPI